MPTVAQALSGRQIWALTLGLSYSEAMIVLLRRLTQWCAAWPHPSVTWGALNSPASWTAAYTKDVGLLRGGTQAPAFLENLRSLTVVCKLKG